MRTQTPALLLALLSALCAAPPPALALTIRFAPLPMEDRETVVKQFKPLAVFLEERLQVTIAFDDSSDYSVIVDKFRRAQLDLAYLGPLPYVDLRKACDQAEPLLRFKEKSGADTYTCALVTFPDAGFDPSNAIDRRVALTQPLSTCGYLSTAGLFRQCGGDLEKNLYRYLDKHDAVALSVIRGEFDAGGLKTAIAKKYGHLGLLILAETKPLPGFVLVGNGLTLSPEMMARIRGELLALEPGGKDADMLSSWGDNIRYGAVMARDADYEEVRRLLPGVRIPMTGSY